MTEIRAALRADVTAAMKARDRDAVSALRTAIAAIDNAEAIATDADHGGQTSGDIAGAVGGVGSTEAARRDLTTPDVRAVLRGTGHRSNHRGGTVRRLWTIAGG